MHEMENEMPGKPQLALVLGPRVVIAADELAHYFRPHFAADELLAEMLAAMRDRRVFLDGLSAHAFWQYPTVEEFAAGHGS
jgi:hypothetical protein